MVVTQKTYASPSGVLSPRDRPPLPDAFLRRLRRDFGEAADALLESLTRPPVLSLRANPLKIDRAELAVRLGRAYHLPPQAFEPVPWSDEGLYFPRTIEPGKHPYHAAGLYYIQEASAMAPVFLLDPGPDERILDLAAAPGGKTTQIAARLTDGGFVLANDIDPGRASAIIENVDRLGLPNVLVTVLNPRKLAEMLPGFFDRVLVDAPCSSEGLFRKKPEAISHWSEAAVDRAARLQAELLDLAVELVKPGGTIVYSTCTWNRLENEETVERFLSRHPDIALHPPTEDEAARLVGADFTPFGVRLLPHRARGEGHFIARFRRTQDADGRLSAAPGMGTDMPAERFRPVFPLARPLERRSPSPAKKAARQRALSPPDATIVQLLKRFFDDALPESPLRPDDSGRVAITRGGMTLIWDPPHVEALPATLVAAALHTLPLRLRGLRLGEMRNGRFLPSHALALAHRPHELTGGRLVPLDLSAAERYLRGETLERPGTPDGYALAVLDGFPLGWVKATGGTLKNHYPKGLRRNVGKP